MPAGCCLDEAPVLDWSITLPDLDSEPEPEQAHEPRPRPAPKQAPVRIIRRWLVMLLLIAVGFFAVLFALQNRVIFPGSETQGKPSSVVHPAPGSELVHLTTEAAEKIVALFGPALQSDGTPFPEAEKRPTVLYFYGNAMCLNDAQFEFDHFRRLGVNVMIPEFVGYGMSEGKPSELGCRETADAALAHLHQRKDVNPKLIVAAGWSLGGAVAIDLAARKPMAGLISFSSFTSMGDMSRRSFPIVPASLLLRHRFDSQAKMRTITCPILLGHGRRDDIVPIEMEERLAATATKAPVMKFVVEDAGHDDFYKVGKEQVLRAMNQFIEQVSDSR